ncbi:MAG TPA: PAS domain S-box protein [Thermodesulfobacteriota bacterium]|nr:PAS domain S-box protein [Thermodesulfobacteriota bacterium]
MKEEPFHRQAEFAQKRLAVLRRRIEDLPETERQPLLTEALEELSVGLEELQVASAELRQQNEELATAQRYAEAEGRRYLDLFDFAPEGYLVTDLNGKIQEANRAASALLSVSQTLLIGKPLSVYIKEEDIEPFGTQLNRLPTLKHLENWEITLQPRDGKPFPAAFTVTTVAGFRHEPPSLRWMIHDISEHKRMEEKLQQSENRLRSLSEKLLTVQEDERKRVALDLHDSLAAILAAVKFNVEGSIQQLRNDGTDKAVLPLLEHALANIQNIFEEVRRIYMDLRPALLDDLGIQATVNWFIREFQNLYSHIRVEKEIHIEEGEVPEPLKIIFFRIMQEAFNLAAKQGKADLIRFSLGRTEDRLQMTIRNNGNGFNIKQAPDVNQPRREYGLLWMRERVELSGGLFEIESLKEGGTVIRASWPAAGVSSPPSGGIS